MFLAQNLYSWRHVVLPDNLVSNVNAVAVVCVSDTHNAQLHLPSGDILIHAGDLTQSGSFEEVQAALTWLSNQPFQHKIVVAGNHDCILDRSWNISRHERQGKVPTDPAQLDWGDITYLENSSATLTCANGRRLRVYGSPLSPQHGNWAFQYPRKDDVWSELVPDDVDILVTHAPPRGHLDLIHIGCVHLLRTLWRTRPALHVFGHVHEGYGKEWLQFDGLQNAYERVVVAGGGVGNLLRVLCEFVQSWVRTPTEPQCLLVNPAIVGGLGEDVRRDPVRVVM